MPRQTRARAEDWSPRPHRGRVRPPADGHVEEIKFLKEPAFFFTNKSGTKNNKSVRLRAGSVATEKQQREEEEEEKKKK